MEFTYRSYSGLIKLLKEHDYNFTEYYNCDDYNKAVIMRHDIDFSISKAISFAEIEAKEGICSTYFVLLSCEFYNILSRSSLQVLKELKDMGHSIGLHFDRTRYGEDFSPKNSNYKQRVMEEVNILSNIIGQKVNCISMHKPVKAELELNINFDGIINAYSEKFFNQFKYFSDSRMRWREDVIGCIENDLYSKMQILTHPIWYENTNANMIHRVTKFVNDASSERIIKIKEQYNYFD